MYAVNKIDINVSPHIQSRRTNIKTSAELQKHCQEQRYWCAGMWGHYSGQTPVHTLRHSRTFIISVALLGDVLGLFAFLFVMELLHHDLPSYTSEAHSGFLICFVIHHSLPFRVHARTHTHTCSHPNSLMVPLTLLSTCVQTPSSTPLPSSRS